MNVSAIERYAMLRGATFVSRKITQAAAHAKMGRPVKLKLQNLGARVDWSSARDVVAAMHLMAASAKLIKSVTELRSGMKEMINTPEMRFQVDESRKFAVIDEVLARLEADGADVNNTDGARVNTPDGWWLLRASNTQDVLVARAEASSEAGLERLMAMIDAQLAASGLERGEQAGH